MTNGFLPRRWTVATWLVAGVGDQTDALAEALAEIAADAVALQYLREREAHQLADALSLHASWEMSHHPRSRLFPGSALGLAVLSPHTLVHSASIPVNDHTSRWSTKRRIAQVALVERDDHSAYALAHSVGSISTRLFDSPSNAPTVRIHPAQIGVDEHRVFELPDGATLVGTAESTPVEDAPPLAQATFEMAWVTGDFPTR